MPPRRNAAPPSPATSRRTAPSPARSTRSTRSRRADDDWENESNHSMAPPSRTGKANGSALNLSNTSVNIAAAFHAAQTGNFPYPPANSFQQTRPRMMPKSPILGAREKSPMEALEASARATSPVGYLLRAPKEDEDPYSFSSLGSVSGDTTYDYQAEAALVKEAQAQQAKVQARVNGARRHVAQSADAARMGRKGRRNDEDLPYRPGENDWQPESDDSAGEGSGVVVGGALKGRAATRGTRKEAGEGYLGNGLGIQPRERRRDMSVDINGFDDDYRDSTPGPAVLHVPPSPAISRSRRATTPIQNLGRAFSPLTERRSPAPDDARHHAPTPLRNVITNLSHGFAITLRYMVGLGRNVLVAIWTKVARNIWDALRMLKHNFWKWAVGVVLASILLRLLALPLLVGPSYSAPQAPPGSMEELVGRLQHIEKAIALLSDSSNLLSEAERHGKVTDDAILSRVHALEGSIEDQRKRLDGAHNTGSTDDLRSSYETLRSEVRDIVKRIETSEGDVRAAQEALRSFGHFDQDFKALQSRVSAVEQEIKSVLEDGRLRDALTRILPRMVPVGIRSDGTVDIDPRLWAELRKMLAGKSDVETAVRSALAAESRSGNGQKSQDIMEWGEQLLDKKIAEGIFVPRREFIDRFEDEIGKLKHLISAIPRQVSSTKEKTQPSSVTIKSGKGEDITSFLQGLVDAALLRYSKDTIARPDFALFTAGARVIPSITSDTLVVQRAGYLAKKVFGSKDVEGRVPATALHPDISVGNCWPFVGGEGQLGVLLNKRAIVSDITIEHAASEIALDISSAPREVEVWGLVEQDHQKDAVARYLEEHPLPDSSVPPSRDHLLLGSFSYDPALPNHIQTFPVDQAIVDLGIDVGIVIFRVRSNWGGDMTCLYRVRVHGEAVEDHA